MKNFYLFLASLLIFSLILSACSPTAEEPGSVGTPSQQEETPMPGEIVAPTPEEQGTPIQPQEDPQEITPTVEPPVVPQPQETPIVPETGILSPHLSQMLTFQVIDSNNNIVGNVTDYIINMCEAHLLYSVVEVDTALSNDGANLMLIPYEAFSLSGEIRFNGQNQLVLNHTRGELADAPTFTMAQLDMNTIEWESEVIDFWQERAPMTFTSDCPVPPAGDASPGAERVIVNRIALATDVLAAEVEDGIGDSMGQATEAIVTPQSGHFRYIVMHTADQFSSLTLVPMGALNVRHTAADGSPRTVLILLVEREILEGSPRVQSIPETYEAVEAQGSFQYWSQHVPMTREELP